MGTECAEQYRCLDDVSGIASIVGFYFAFRLAIPILAMRLAGIDPQAASALKLGLGLILLIAVCFVSIGASAGDRRSIGSRPVRWVFVFLGFSGVSFLWSETASLAASMAYWSGTAIDVATVLLLFRRGEASKVSASIMSGFIWAACGIALIAWSMPAQYDLRLGDEVFFSANSICNVCVFAVFFMQYLMRQGRAKSWIIMLLLMLTIIRTLSKTTIAAFLVCEAFFLIRDHSMSRKSKLLISFAAVAVLLTFWGLFEAYYNFYTTSGNQAETLTGRTAIWAYALDSIAERPWIGHGFDSMWNVAPVFGTFEARHAENELLEQLYSYGLVGAVMLFGIYGSLYRNIRRLAPTEWKPIGLSMILFVVIRGFAEAEPFDLLLPLWVVVMFAYLLENARIKSQATEFAAFAPNS